MGYSRFGSPKGSLLTTFNKKVNHPVEAAERTSQHPAIKISREVLQRNANPKKKPI